MGQWQEIINYLEMVAEWVQVIFTGFGVILAFGYLSQHAKKVRVERSYALVHGCMVKLSKYVGTYHLFYKKVSYPKHQVILGEVNHVEAIDEIDQLYNKLKLDMVDMDLLSFEIDAEIKLISNSVITFLWNELQRDHEKIGIQFEKLYFIKSDQQKCIDFIDNIPFGILGDDYPLTNNFSKTYHNLMKMLLSFYKTQESELSYTSWIRWERKKKQR